MRDGSRYATGMAAARLARHSPKAGRCLEHTTNNTGHEESVIGCSLTDIYYYKILDLIKLQFIFCPYGVVGQLVPPFHIQPNLLVCILGLGLDVRPANVFHSISSQYYRHAYFMAYF